LEQTEGVIAHQLGRLARHSAIYGMGAVVSRLIGVFLLPVVTRYPRSAPSRRSSR